MDSSASLVPIGCRHLYVIFPKTIGVEFGPLMWKCSCSLAEQDILYNFLFR